MEAALRKAPPFPTRNTKKSDVAGAGKKPLPPPGISGTVASLVISPEWFAANPKETNRRERKWWSPGTVSLFCSLLLLVYLTLNLLGHLVHCHSSAPLSQLCL